jgi:hypothetical protein
MWKVLGEKKKRGRSRTIEETIAVFQARDYVGSVLWCHDVDLHSNPSCVGY